MCSLSESQNATRVATNSSVPTSYRNRRGSYPHSTPPSFSASTDTTSVFTSTLVRTWSFLYSLCPAGCGSTVPQLFPRCGRAGRPRTTWTEEIRIFQCHDSSCRRWSVEWRWWQMAKWSQLPSDGIRNRQRPDMPWRCQTCSAVPNCQARHVASRAHCLPVNKRHRRTAGRLGKFPSILDICLLPPESLVRRTGIECGY